MTRSRWTQAATAVATAAVLVTAGCAAPVQTSGGGTAADGTTSTLIGADNGTLEVLVADDVLRRRKVPAIDLTANEYGFGRELFAGFRQMVGRADQGAAAFAA